MSETNAQEERLEALRYWCVLHNYDDDSGGLDAPHVEAFLAGYDAGKSEAENGQPGPHE